MLPLTHRLAQMPMLHLRDLRDLRDENFILRHKDQMDAGWSRIMAACRAVGLEPCVVQEMDNEQAIIILIIAGMGVGSLTESTRGLLPAGVVMKRVEDFSVPMKLEFVWLQSTPSTLLANFVEVVRQTSALTTRPPASD